MIRRRGVRAGGVQLFSSALDAQLAEIPLNTNDNNNDTSSTSGGQWDGRRLLLSFGACAVLIIAAVIWEQCG